MEPSEYYDNYSTENSFQNPQSPPETPRQSPIKRLAFAILKALGYFAIYFGIQVIAGFVISGYAVLSTESVEEAQRLYDELWNRYAMHIMIVIDVVFLAIIALIFFLRRKNALSVRQNLGLKNPVPGGRLALIFGMGVTLNYAITIPLGILQSMMPQKAVEDYSETQAIYHSGGLAVYIISGVILAPIVEELLFRGLISARLTRGMPVWIAVLVSAVGFGFMHDSLIQALYASLLGILLGVVFFREDSLIASVVLHFAFNFASLLPYILSGFGDSDVIDLLYGSFVLLCIPIGIIMLITYLMSEKKKAPVQPGAPGVNGWLMRE